MAIKLIIDVIIVISHFIRFVGNTVIMIYNWFIITTINIITIELAIKIFIVIAIIVNSYVNYAINETTLN